MEQIESLPQIKAFSALIAQVKDHFAHAEKGHDFAHTMRVAHLAVAIGRTEQADEDLLFLGALLHDVADHKFDYRSLEEIAMPWQGGSIPADQFSRAIELAKSVSFSSQGGTAPTDWLELRCLRDADRLEAIGAMGIARCFHYGGFKNRELFNPSVPFGSANNPTAPSLNHFFEKLLGLRDGMYTQAGKEMAEPRHQLLVEFVDRFLQEWFYPQEVPLAWKDGLNPYK